MSHFDLTSVAAAAADAQLSSSPLSSDPGARIPGDDTLYPTPNGPMSLAQVMAFLGDGTSIRDLAEAALESLELPHTAKPEGPAALPRDPATEVEPGSPTQRGTPRVRRWPVHWRHAAVLIARGVGVTAIAHEYGVCESVILRNLQRSPRFRRWIREAEAAVEADAARHAAWLRLRAASNLANRAERDDPKTLDLLTRQIADLARDRIKQASEALPETTYARLSGFSKRDFR